MKQLIDNMFGTGGKGKGPRTGKRYKALLEGKRFKTKSQPQRKSQGGWGK